MASKSATQVEIEKIDAEIAVLQATRARLLAMQQAQPKRKTRKVPQAELDAVRDNFEKKYTGT